MHRLAWLKELDLMRAPLEGFPTVICTLRSLETLNISSCGQAMVLPEDIGNLTSLETLIADCNSIPELPDSISALVKLRHVSLWNNHLATVCLGSVPSCFLLVFLTLLCTTPPFTLFRRSSLALSGLGASASVHTPVTFHSCLREWCISGGPATCACAPITSGLCPR